MKNLQITLTILFILLASLLWAVKPQPVAMRRESRPVVGEIVEGRSVIVNMPGYTWILEV